MPLQPALDDTAFEADIELAEYESSEPIELSQTAADMLTDEINGGDDRDGDRIKLHYTREGTAVLTATQYVGVVSLRDGPTIQITPKAGVDHPPAVTAAVCPQHERHHFRDPNSIPAEPDVL